MQDIVEDTPERNLADIAALGVTQVRCKIQIELFFRDFYGYRAHDETLSEQEPGLADGSIMHTASMSVKGGRTLKFARFSKV